jgi:hypothetical protein
MRFSVPSAFRVLTALSTVGGAHAAPGTASGPIAFALASVIASHSSVLSSYERRAMARLFGGNSISFPPNRTISVKADVVICRASNVDLTSRSCEATFGTGKRVFTGREANELHATLSAAGIASQGAAGSITASASNIVCTINPNEIRQKAGSGAECSFVTGP